jgi:glycosyltransferase involved in cell wall biosynthesis
MNELVSDGQSGILVPGHPAGEAKSGIPAFEPDVGELSEAIERVAEPEILERLARGALEVRERLRWGRTVEALSELLERVAPATAGAPPATRA